MPPTPEVNGFWQRYKIAIWLSIVPVGVVAFAYVASQQTNDGTKQIAIFACAVAAAGFLISYAKFVYDIRDKEQDRSKKNAEKLESIRASVIYIADQKGDMKIGLELYNFGMTDVNIKHVILYVTKDGIQQCAEMSFPTDEIKIRMAGSLQFKETVTLKNLVLGVKDFVRFWVSPTYTKDQSAIVLLKSESLVAMPPECLWMVAESFVGPVARIDGSDIVEAINKHAASPAA